MIRHREHRAHGEFFFNLENKNPKKIKDFLVLAVFVE